MILTTNLIGRGTIWALFVLVLYGCTLETSQEQPRYITWDGLEPDKWASVWLIKRQIDTNAEIVLRPVGAPTNKGIAFGVPGAKYRRSHGISVYESLRDGFYVEDPVLKEIGAIIHDIEIASWGQPASPHSAVVERSFRRLQDSFEARNVPVDCYGLFFDQVYSLIERDSPDYEWKSLEKLARTEPACHTDTGTLARRDLSPFVRRLESHTVLDNIAADRKVVFVDVREPAEYAEYRIPGAVNLQLRDVTPELKSRFEGADLVIPYCIKDFRGFEMARSLAEIGVQNVGIMKPYGIAGWRHAGLPIASRNGLTEDEASEKLIRCARAGTCLADPS